MVKHIVMLRLKDSAHGNTRAENARIIKQKIEALRDQIPGIRALEVGLDWSATEQSADLVLYSEFESRAALDAYQAHPAHQAILPFIAEARSERRLVDYDFDSPR
jgi:quinol monooxygenase YgiN